MKKPEKRGAVSAKDVEDFVTSKGPIDKVRDYVQRGRRFERRDTESLKNEWIDVLRRLLPNLADPGLRLSWDDIETELAMRGEEAPIKRASGELDALSESVGRCIEEIEATDPDKWDDMNKALTSDILRFLEKKGRAN